VVVYMPGSHYEDTAQQLQAAGLEASTPCAIISQATSAREQVCRTTLDALPRVPRLPAPTLLVVGEVVRFADHASLHQQFEWMVAQDTDPLWPAEFLAEAGPQEQSE
jgi:siroheme synthase